MQNNLNPSDRSTIQQFNPCEACEAGSLQVPLQQQQATTAGSAVQQVSIDTQSGRAGLLQVPNDVGGRDLDVNLEVNYIRGPAASNNPPRGTVGATIVEIILQDSEGSDIRQLQEPMTICLDSETSLPGAKREDVCLSYYDEDTSQWVCQDECLSQEDGLLCGKTPHLTNFALLLNPASGNNCGENALDETVVWLSTAFAIAAGLGIVVAVLVIEIRFQIVRIRQKRFLREISRQSSAGLL